MYKVIWGNTEYILKALRCEPSTDGGGVYLGNLKYGYSVFYPSVTEPDTGEPFLIALKDVNIAPDFSQSMITVRCGNEQSDFNLAIYENVN